MDEGKQVSVKVNSTKDGSASVDVTEKKHVVELIKTHEDCYETINIIDFVEYLKSNFESNFAIYYNVEEACAYQLDTVNIIGTKARCIAKCDITPSNMRDKLNQLNGKTQNYNDFQDFLNEYRKVFDVKAKDLLVRLKDFRITKETKVERLQDNQGNFAYSVSRKGKKDEVEFPEDISFTIPILDFIEDKVELKFDFQFSFIPSGDDVRFGFKIINYNLDQILIETTRGLLEDKLPKKVSYFGNLKSSAYDDCDKYKIIS